MLSRRATIPSLVLVAALALAACGADEPAAVDTGSPQAPTDDALVHPDTPPGDVTDDPDSSPTTAPAGQPASTPAPAPDPAGGIEPAEGTQAPAGEVVMGRVVRVDRDGPSVEIVESQIVTGTDATVAARAAGEIGPDEEWELDFYVVEGARRWVDIEPSATVGVYDCTQACEHVAGTIEHVLSGAPYGGADALWTFGLAGGRATSVEEVYLP